MDIKNSWTGKLLRHFVFALIGAGLALLIVLKWVVPDLNKKIYSQKAEQITNIQQTIISEPKGSLFNSDNEFLWGFFGIKLRFGKPVREKLNGEQGK